MPTTSTPATPKKIARRRVKRVNGQLVVVYIDVATGQEITDLTGYSIEPDATDGTNGGGTSTPTPTPTETKGGNRRDGTSGREDYTGNGLANPSVGSMNMGDVIGGIGGFVSGAVNLIDMIGGATDGKDAQPAAGVGAGFAAPNYTAATKTPVTTVSSSIKPSAGPIGGVKAGQNAGWDYETASKDLPPEQRAFLDTLAIGDGSGGYWESPSYSTIVGKGGTFNDFSKHPGKVGFKYTNPKSPYYGKTSDAAGRYQMLGSTWRDVVSQYNRVNPKTPITDFSPESQDRAALFLAARDYATSTGRDLFADLKNPPNQIGQYIKKGLGSTWAILKEKTANEIASAFVYNVNKNVQAAQAPTDLGMPAPLSFGDKGSPNYNPNANPAGTNDMAKGAAWVDAFNARNAPGYVPPTLQDLMGKFNSLPGVVPNPANAGFSGNPANVDSANSAFNQPSPTPGVSPPVNDVGGPIARAVKAPKPDMFTYPGQNQTLARPTTDRPAAAPLPVNQQSFDEYMDDMIAKSQIPDVAFGKAQASAYLDTINESLGSPAFNTTFDGTPVSEGDGHPNLKAWLNEGNEFTTAAGYGGLTKGIWEQYAPKVGAGTFSLDDQKKVMMAVAMDNYGQKTGRDLLADLSSGKEDSVFSALVNSSNLWSTLPGGATSTKTLQDTASVFNSKSQGYVPPTKAQPMDPLYVDTETMPTVNPSFGIPAPNKAFAMAPSTVVNSSGQVMNKSAADAMRSMSGVDNYADTGFASKASSTLNNVKSQSSGIGGGVPTSKSYGGSETPAPNNVTRSTTSVPKITSNASTQTKATTKPTSSLGTAMSSGLGNTKTASPTQKVTTATGSTITKAQKDALSRL